MTTLVRDVMTTDVVTVDEAAPFKEVVRLLVRHRIGALPVTGAAGRIVGIVSETDLLLKEASPQAVRGGPPFEGRRRHRERRRAAGRTAGELMTSPAATIAPTTPVARAAHLMHERKVAHLPVADADGRLVGIVSRGDLARVFVRPDEDIRREVLDLLSWSVPDLDPAEVRVRVAGGLVQLAGYVERRSEAVLLTYRARQLDGVVGVDAELDFDLDDWTPVHEGDPYRAIPLRM